MWLVLYIAFVDLVNVQVNAWYCRNDLANSTGGRGLGVTIKNFNHLENIFVFLFALLQVSSQEKYYS